MDKFTGRSKGFGFVEMGSAEEAQAAIEQFDGQELDGRPLKVNIARPKERYIAIKYKTPHVGVF